MSPMYRALQQFDDPVFIGVLLRSVAWSVVAFLGLSVGCVWAVHLLLLGPGWLGWLGWLVGIVGGLAAGVLAIWLFVPVAVLIATFYIERVAAAVDRRFYPELAVAHSGAPLSIQLWDGAVLGAQVLVLQLLALVLAVLLPGVGLVLGFAITGWAIGRGLFVAVAMRRMNRAAALHAYAARRGAVLLQGGLLALAGHVPVLNLLVPVVGIAALTHVLNGSRQFRHSGPTAMGSAKPPAVWDTVPEPASRTPRAVSDDRVSRSGVAH